MTDQNSSNHWESLASELGAEIEPVVEEPRPSGAPQPQPVASQPMTPLRAAPRPRRQDQPESAAETSWDLLAGELGIVPLPPPPQPAPSSSVPAAEKPPEAVVAAALAKEPIRRAVPPAESAEESPNFFDERFDFEEPFDLLESADVSAAEADAPAAVVEPSEKRSRKRRRRHRRGRESRQADTREPALPAAGDAGSADDSSAADEDFDRSNITAEAEAPQTATVDIDRPGDEATALAEEGLSKRHRPRRKKKPHGGDRSRAVAGERDPREAGSDVARSSKSEEIEPALVGHSDTELVESDQDEAEPSGRLGFRGIPSWEEVIGLIVDKNLEGRTKRPGGRTHPSRGGKPPRNHRGGRGDKRRS